MIRRTMGTNDKSVQLKVYLDKKKKKVKFAVAEEDFVEILFSFFTLPLGTIAKLSRKYSNNDIKVGSLTSLYGSVVDLNLQHFSSKNSKDGLLNPRNSSLSHCKKLKVNLDETNPMDDSVATDDVVFLKNKGNFIITDDLNVKPFMLDKSIQLLNSLGVESINCLEERKMRFGLEEFSNLLMWSLSTNTPLTNLVIGGSKKPWSSTSRLTNSTLIDITSANLFSSNIGKITQPMKLLVHKAKKKVLCAQVEHPFVELLFSFLTIPLGSFVRLTKEIDDDSSPVQVGIINLYKSISCLADENHLESEDVKAMLLCPKIANSYRRVTEFLPIYDVNKGAGHFLKEHARIFIVSDELEVTISQSIDVISKFNKLGVHVADMEVMEVTIGEQEALLLLKASLSSTSALTDCFDPFRKKPKDHVPNIGFAEDGGSDSGEEVDYSGDEVGFTLEDEDDSDESFVIIDL
ncbi:unnamed protein product [Lactuca saligna]|uniref:DUF674 family protein n=1 Tax=Lactuca saligna TaxID=75948 RepID=A0AA35ZZ93_LACSI|nr:unnamed protein product [Lactuca saligna]